MTSGPRLSSPASAALALLAGAWGRLGDAAARVRGAARRLAARQADRWGLWPSCGCPECLAEERRAEPWLDELDKAW